MNTLQRGGEQPMTPNKRITPIQDLRAPYKQKLRRYARTKKLAEEKAQDLLLYDASKKHFLRYHVYLDDEVGIDRCNQHLLIKASMDEDCDSSDEIVEDGVRRAMSALKLALTKKKK